MAWEEDSRTMLIGFVIVLIVGINIILFFGEMTNLGGNALTGAATVNCEDIAGGIQCGDTTFVLASGRTCPYSTSVVCTNNCELSRLYANDNRVCPTVCTDVCLPTNIAEKL
jgi:hypothetical protein